MKKTESSEGLPFFLTEEPDTEGEEPCGDEAKEDSCDMDQTCNNLFHPGSGGFSFKFVFEIANNNSWTHNRQIMDKLWKD